MKKLSRDEMKKVMGGGNESKSCTTDADCGSKTISCGGQNYLVDGHCNNQKCSWNTVC